MTDEPGQGNEDVQIPLSGEEMIRRYGARFDGTPWILMVPFADPLEEVGFVAALDPHIVHASSGRPTGLQLLLIETPHGYVLRFSIILIDDPRAPFELRLPVNPHPGGAFELLVELAEQKTIQIAFLGMHSGLGIGRRIIRFDAEERASLAWILELTKDRPSDYEQWMAAVDAAREFL